MIEQSKEKRQEIKIAIRLMLTGFDLFCSFFILFIFENFIAILKYCCIVVFYNNETI